MLKTAISNGVAHKVPEDLKKVLISAPEVRVAWEDLTPLARNEWICWVVTNKRPETRRNHIERIREELLSGKRRPCCWAGCIHRKDKPLSPTMKWMMNKQSKSK